MSIYTTFKELKYLKTILFNPTAWGGHGLFAMKLVEEINPKVVVDLGVDYGFSTFCFGYNKIGNVYGIDWFEGDVHTGHRDNFPIVKKLQQELVISHGINNIEFIKSDFNLESKNWNKKIDILHIDGFHSYEAVKSDYENWIGFCEHDSVVLFHDTVSFPETVGKFFNEVKGYKLHRINSAGLGILTKSKTVYEKINKFKNEGSIFDIIIKIFLKLKIITKSFNKISN
jgi:hypothetical protein